MNIEIFTVCDYACDYGQNKLNIIGTFDRINAQVYPFKLQHCAVATRLRVGKHELGKHVMEIRFLDADGKQMQHVRVDMEIPINQAEDYAIVTMPMNIGNLMFSKPGKYAVELHWDGEFASGLNIYARQVQPMQRAA